MTSNPARVTRDTPGIFRLESRTDGRETSRDTTGAEILDRKIDPRYDIVITFYGHGIEGSIGTPKGVWIGWSIGGASKESWVPNYGTTAEAIDLAITALNLAAERGTTDDFDPFPSIE